MYEVVRATGRARSKEHAECGAVFLGKTNMRGGFHGLIRQPSVCHAKDGRV